MEFGDEFDTTYACNTMLTSNKKHQVKKSEDKPKTSTATKSMKHIKNVKLDPIADQLYNQSDNIVKINKLEDENPAVFANLFAAISLSFVINPIFGAVSIIYGREAIHLNTRGLTEAARTKIRTAYICCVAGFITFATILGYVLTFIVK